MTQRKEPDEFHSKYSAQIAWKHYLYIVPKAHSLLYEFIPVLLHKFPCIQVDRKVPANGVDDDGELLGLNEAAFQTRLH